MNVKQVVKPHTWNQDLNKTNIIYESLNCSTSQCETNKVEYRLEGWVKNFEDYLKSAMSYTNSRNLESFKESQIVFITENSLKRYKKWKL